MQSDKVMLSCIRYEKRKFKKSPKILETIINPGGGRLRGPDDQTQSWQ